MPVPDDRYAVYLLGWDWSWLGIWLDWVESSLLRLRKLSDTTFEVVSSHMGAVKAIAMYICSTASAATLKENFLEWLHPLCHHFCSNFLLRKLSRTKLPAHCCGSRRGIRVMGGPFWCLVINYIPGVSFGGIRSAVSGRRGTRIERDRGAKRYQSGSKCAIMMITLVVFFFFFFFSSSSGWGKI